MSDNCDNCGMYKLACICENIPFVGDEITIDTFETITVSEEEMDVLQGNLFKDDIDGGLQNIEVPQEALDKIREDEEYARTFIDIKNCDDTPCYRTDQVHLKLTAENLVVLKHALESLSLDMRTEIPYMSEELDTLNLYHQQSYIRMLRDQVDDTINEYVKYRPYTPFLPTWVKKIGKDNVRAEKDL